MKHAIAVACIAFAATAGIARAEEPIELKFAIPTPPISSVSKGLQPWAEQIAKESDGAIKVQLFLGPTVATIFNAYDRVTNGVLDMAFGNFGPLASQLPVGHGAKLIIHERHQPLHGLAIPPGIPRLGQQFRDGFRVLHTALCRIPADPAR